MIKLGKKNKIDDKYLWLLSDYYAEVMVKGYKIEDLDKIGMPLDDEIRTYLTLHYVLNDITMEEIAIFLGLNELTIYTIINDVVEHLNIKFNDDYE